MKLIDCPTLGLRPSTEFIYNGIVDEINDEQETKVSDFFYKDGTADTKLEWWYHTPSQNWFIIKRNTRNDQITSVVFATEYFNG